MASKCPKCDKTVYFAEKVSSLGKDWHKLCLKCDRCNKLLNAGGHAEHDGRPYCHKPCYAALFGPKGVNIGGAGSYVYDAPTGSNAPPAVGDDAPGQAEEKKTFAAKAPSKAGGVTTFSGEANMCPRCNKKVYFAEKVTSLGKDWHRPCLRCERCSKTLSAGSHAEHDGQPYCHKPCYAVLFGPKEREREHHHYICPLLLQSLLCAILSLPVHSSARNASEPSPNSWPFCASSFFRRQHGRRRQLHLRSHPVTRLSFLPPGPPLLPRPLLLTTCSSSSPFQEIPSCSEQLFLQKKKKKKVQFLVTKWFCMVNTSKEKEFVSTVNSSGLGDGKDGRLLHCH